MTYSIQWGWRRPAGTPSCRWAGWCALGIPISRVCFCGQCLSPPCEAQCQSYAASGSPHSRFWGRKNTRIFLYIYIFENKINYNTDKMKQKWSFYFICQNCMLLQTKNFAETVQVFYWNSAVSMSGWNKMLGFWVRKDHVCSLFGLFHNVWDNQSHFPPADCFYTQSSVWTKAKIGASLMTWPWLFKPVHWAGLMQMKSLLV